EPFRPDDRLQFCVAAVACVGFAPAVLLGAPAWAAASVGATVVALAAAVRQRHRLRWALVPWRLVLLTTGLFLVVSAVGLHGLDDLLTRLVGPGGSARVTAAAAAAANGVNNLPAYLALERSTPPGDLPALLVGVNVGPLVLLWGSLATLLWRERCRARGVHISARQFTLLGLAGVPVLLAATVLVLP
ncbi:MAG: arsenical pump rane protein, partial [Frankiaceae bacterium]|nr:arsenical pump rane protein [Frankiaceae bacterium]